MSRLTVHLVWVTKYRYQVLRAEVKERCRELIMQIGDAEDVGILKGVVSKDHVHMHVEYPPSVSVSKLMKHVKGRTSRLCTRRVSTPGETLLGQAFLGSRLWGMEHREYN